MFVLWLDWGEEGNVVVLVEEGGLCLPHDRRLSEFTFACEVNMPSFFLSDMGSARFGSR